MSNNKQVKTNEDYALLKSMKRPEMEIDPILQNTCNMERNLSIKYAFHQMSNESALEIANHWRYEGDYSFYDADQDQEDYEELISEQRRGDSYFEAIYNNELVGYYAINQEDSEIEIGIGLRPDLCGYRRGKDFLLQVEEDILQHYHADYFMLVVAAFNLRAIKTYQSCGYVEYGKEDRQTNGGTYPFILMKKCII